MEIEDDHEESTVKQVDLTVPKTDDPTVPVLTFRMWVLGLSTCIILSFVNQFFWYRTQPMSVSSIAAQIAVVPLGHLMARKLPTRKFFEGTSWEFTLNPGPFNIKEHVLITIFANSGAGTVYATHILTSVKIYYQRKLTFLPALFVMITTQMLGFGWAGLFRKYLVEPGEMWWPSSGYSGLGIGAVGFDWATISSYLGSPLASPWFATANVAVGFFLIMYVMTPLCYWLNIYNAKNFPIYSANLFTSKGEVYDTLEIINSKFHLDRDAYARHGRQPGLNVVTEYIIGYMYPERPVANMCFKVYGYISMAQALTFLGDFKLGHYMKIPPRSMFMAQVVGTLVSVFVYQGTAWWMMDAIPNLCGEDNGQWKCPQDNVFFKASVIWGLVGPRRIFGNLGEYGKVNWFFMGGAVAPLIVWLFHKAFPSKKWISLIHMPVLLGATAMMPPASAVNFTSWIIVGFLSGFVLFRYRTEWWRRYNYVLSGGLDAGTAFMTLLIFFLSDTGMSAWHGGEAVRTTQKDALWPAVQLPKG
ncbi:unnamed protein product [Dovyalis caffra]|uniref:Oligopeptide transporter n=1 Tax=Dovyalis caffra TaxID=77055 RepID=A0AAV1QTX9_9ROSI|nr:unnamed protein product [Dovyalis caffra]